MFLYRSKEKLFGQFTQECGLGQAGVGSVDDP